MIAMELGKDSVQTAVGMPAVGPCLPVPQNLSGQEVAAFQRALVQPESQALRASVSPALGQISTALQPGSMSELNALARDRWLESREGDSDRLPRERADPDAPAPAVLPPLGATLPMVPAAAPDASGPARAPRVFLPQALAPAVPVTVPARPEQAGAPQSASLVTPMPLEQTAMRQSRAHADSDAPAPAVLRPLGAALPTVPAAAPDASGPALAPRVFLPQALAPAVPVAVPARPEQAGVSQSASLVTPMPSQQAATRQPLGLERQPPSERHLNPGFDRSALEPNTLSARPLGASPGISARQQTKESEPRDEPVHPDTSALSLRADLPGAATSLSSPENLAQVESPRVDPQAVRELVSQVRRTLAQRDLEALDAGRPVRVSLPEGVLPVDRLEIQGDGQGGLATITLVAATASEGDMLRARVVDLRAAVGQDIPGLRIEVRSEVAPVSVDAQSSSAMSGGTHQGGQGSQQPSREDVLQALDQIQRRASVASAGQLMGAASDFQRRVVAGE